MHMPKYASAFLGLGMSVKIGFGIGFGFALALALASSWASVGKRGVWACANGLRLACALRRTTSDGGPAVRKATALRYGQGYAISLALSKWPCGLFEAWNLTFELG